jgi:hypothetical protein
MCFLYAGYDAPTKNSAAIVTTIPIVRATPRHKKVDKPAQIAAIAIKSMRPAGEITTNPSKIKIPDVHSNALAD